MIRRNPYYIQDNIRLDLRDSKGRYSAASKAKRYYIYIDGQLVDGGEFPRVNMPVLEKEVIVTEVINRLYAEGIREVVEPEIREEVDIRPPEEKKKKPQREVDEQLAEILYEDLLEYLYDEFPLDFELITGKKVKSRGKTRRRDKTFNQYTIDGSKNKGIAYNDFYTHKLDRPINLMTTDPEDLIGVVEKYLIPEMKRVFDRSRDGEHFFLISLLYKQLQKTEVDGKEVLRQVDKGISIGRFRAETWDEFYDFVTDEDMGLYSVIRDKYKDYLKASVDNTITTIGFKIEHLYDYE